MVKAWITKRESLLRINPATVTPSSISHAMIKHIYIWLTTPIALFQAAFALSVLKRKPDQRWEMQSRSDFWHKMQHC